MGVNFDRVAVLMERGAGAARIPKYVRLYNAIYTCVEAGDLASGDQLPPESELARNLPASLGTVQKALNMLAEQNVIVREHGRGTFVTGRGHALTDVWHFRFLSDDGKSVLPVFTEVIDVDEVDSSGPWATFLTGVDRYVRITRRINVDGEFDALSWFLLDAMAFGELLTMPPQELNGVHLRDVVRDEFGVATLRVSEQVICETLPDTVRETLGLVEDAVGLVCHIRGFGHRDLPVSYQILFVPPGTRRIEVLERQPMA